MDAKRITTIARSRRDKPVGRLSSLFSGLASGIRCPCFTKVSQGRLVSFFTVRRLSSAFTLVELMVVVAIVAIMLMLLVPNIRTMREKAWSAHCQNNLRQYGIAMGQYMADHSGYFIYPGFGVGAAVDGSTLPGSDVGSMAAYKRGAVGGATVGGQSGEDWDDFVTAYIGANVTLASLSAGEVSVRVCPVVLRDLHVENYFDPKSPAFKGYRTYQDPYTLDLRDFADFEDPYGAGYDGSGALQPGYATNFLCSYFTSYAINAFKVGLNKSAIPQNVVAFIDWNARDGWGALIGTTNWMFNGTNSAGVTVVQDASKGTNAWWLTEVGFYHMGISNAYGANYVAMDGHVGWVSSNTISTNLFY